MCQATDSADSSKLKCFLCSIHQHICDRTLSYISALLRVPRLPLPPLQTKPLSRWTDKRDRPTATSAPEGPAGSGKAVGLPPERWCAGGGHYGLCWWLSEEPQQEPGAHGPNQAQSKSDAAASRRRHPPWSTTSQVNKSRFGTQGYHLHPSCANMGIMETNYQLEESRTWSLPCLWAVTRTAAKQLKKVTPALHTFTAWTVRDRVRLPLGLGTQRWPPPTVPMSYMGVHPGDISDSPDMALFLLKKTRGTMGWC